MEADRGRRLRHTSSDEGSQRPHWREGQQSCHGRVAAPSDQSIDIHTGVGNFLNGTTPNQDILMVVERRWRRESWRFLWGGGKDSIGQRERFSLFRFSGTRGGLACEAEFETEDAGTFLQTKRPHRLTSVPRNRGCLAGCWATGTKLPTSALLFRGSSPKVRGGQHHTPSRPRRPINPHRSPPSSSQHSHLSSSLPAAIIPGAVAAAANSIAVLPSSAASGLLCCTTYFSRLRKLPPNRTHPVPPTRPPTAARPPRCCCCSVSYPSPYSVSRSISPLEGRHTRTLHDTTTVPRR